MPQMRRGACQETNQTQSKKGGPELLLRVVSFLPGVQHDVFG